MRRQDRINRGERSSKDRFGGLNKKWRKKNKTGDNSMKNSKRSSSRRKVTCGESKRELLGMRATILHCSTKMGNGNPEGRKKGI